MEKPESQYDTTTIGGVTGYLVHHPLDAVLWRWNWKAGLLSALLRSPIFLAAYLWKKEALLFALGATLLQFVFRMVFGGINGALIQAYTRVEPAWQAVLTVPIVLAIVSHIVEFLLQTAYDEVMGTTGKGKAIIASITVSAISAVFNLFAMRRGALLVKDEKQQSLFKDLKRFPLITTQFIFYVPWKVWGMIQNKRYVVSILATLTTSAGLGVVVGILSNKLNWGIITGVMILALIITSIILFEIREMIGRGRYALSFLSSLVTSVGLGLVIGILFGKVTWGIVTGISVLILIVISFTLLVLFNARKLGHQDA